MIIRALAKVFKELMMSAEKRDTLKKISRKKFSDFTDLLQAKDVSISWGKKEHSNDTVFRSSKGNIFLMI